MATDEVVTVVAAPATAADDDSDEELHPADKKMLPLAGAITAAATESPDMTKNNDRLVAAMTAALAVVDTVEDLKALVDHLPTSGEFKLTCYMLSYLVLCVHERPLNLFMPPPTAHQNPQPTHAAHSLQLYPQPTHADRVCVSRAPFRGILWRECFDEPPHQTPKGGRLVAGRNWQLRADEEEQKRPQRSLEHR